ncbi:hypothetical protein D0Z08_29300 [Nocardioides immobilis]|uniref:Uncharacterized protein n=1 Tax=Nocardioides immobilis TaxID=2049295 RepID=A0A417XSP5_9ACTN|nr:hypothetical protein [Nocardioides immobilis]RHW23514.1 hypothetical protein D0Z08_29300 [Nocardioides immobilis]
MEPRQAERDALEARCADAEQRVADLTAELAAANARIADLEAAAESPMSIFDGPDDGSAGAGLARDGSDPRVLSMILAATAVVAGMVALLALINGNLFTTFGFAMILTTVGLAYAASRTRVMGVDVSITRGVVYIKKGESSYRFDVRQDGTRVDMVGQPGDAFWQLRFHRKGLDDFVVDADMVEPHEFVRQLREYRPGL